MAKPKILLIVPPVEDKYTNLVTNSNLLTSIRKYPALGLGYIAAVLEHNNYPVEFIDMFALEMSYDELKMILEKSSPHYVGITTDIATIIPAKKITGMIHDLNPKCVVIGGGVNNSFYPNEIIAGGCFDIGIIGEGEETIVELIDAIENGEDMGKIKGIAFRKGDEVIITDKRPVIKDLDSLPFPARHLMPNERYISNVGKRNTITTMLTSRGCPFNCLFCTKETSYRRRSMESVVAEIEHIKKDLGIDEIMFADSVFSVDIDHSIEICKEICHRKINIIWSASTRVDCISQELLYWMKKAGCVRIQYGVESGESHVLKTLRKGITLNQVRDAVKWTKDAKLELMLHYMIGCPGDTIESIKKTIDLAVELDSDFATFTITTAMPNTDMMKLVIEMGIVDSDPFISFVKGEINEIPKIVCITEEYDREKLAKLLKEAYRRFYFRPRYIVKRLRKIHSFSELMNHITGFKNVLIEVTSR